MENYRIVAMYFPNTQHTLFTTAKNMYIYLYSNIKMPGKAWIKNYCGLHMSDEDYQDIPAPYTEFVLHVSLKSTLLGTLIGRFLMKNIIFHGNLGDVLFMSLRI